MKINLLIVLITLSINGLTQKQTTKQYIEKWKNEAITQMNLHKIPASITLAQGILESGNGNSKLASKANNHFGIKCHKSWTGKTFYQDDDEKDECFRKYNNAKESFKDHSLFLQKNRYKGLFELKITDYKGWAKGLKKAGYATNPKYPKLLISLVERYNLSQYDTPEDLIAANLEEKKKEEKTPIVIKEGKSDNSPTETIVYSLKRKNGKTANKVPFVVTRKGDSYAKLAKDLQIREWQIRKYNDLMEKHTFSEGERVFTKPKRCRAKEKYHYAKKGETFRDISQLYGVKLKKLYRKNRMEKGTNPKTGQKIYLRKRKKK